MRLARVMPLVALAACAAPKPFVTPPTQVTLSTQVTPRTPITEPHPVQPAAAQALPQPTADPQLISACAAAPLLRPRQPFKRATLTKARPRLIVRVDVLASRDSTKGEGQVAVSGASRSIAVRSVDMQTKTLQEGQVLGACFEDFVVFETAGEHCLVLEYDDDARGRPLTFDYDFGSRMHVRATHSAYEEGLHRSVCGDN